MAVKKGLRLIPGSSDPGSGSLLGEDLVEYKLASGDSNVDIWSKNAPYKMRIVDMYVVMHGAGATGDKVKIQRGDGAASESFADISDDIDVSAKSDKDLVRASTLDDAQWDIAKGESLRIVSTSGALAFVFIKVAPDPGD